jgi:hypothetical protein
VKDGIELHNPYIVNMIISSIPCTDMLRYSIKNQTQNAALSLRRASKGGAYYFVHLRSTYYLHVDVIS